MRISDWSSDVCSSDLGYRVRDSRPFAYGHVELWIKAVFMDHIVDDPVERLVCVFSRGQIHFDRCEAVLRLPRQEKLVQKLIVIFEMMLEPAPRYLDTLAQAVNLATFDAKIGRESVREKVSQY